MTEPDLDKAYALETPQDNLDLYADWAETYDQAFAGDMDYQMPRLVALVLAEVFDGPGPVLDVGAGTGLVAEHMLGRGAFDVDALDLSPEMLAVARSKGVYRQTIEADLTRILPIEDAQYGAVISSGTFTHGHVGPDALDELLRVARNGACFVLSVNAAHFEARGFAKKFALLEPDITGLLHRRVRIYGDAVQDAAHKEDEAFITVFEKR